MVQVSQYFRYVTHPAKPVALIYHSLFGNGSLTSTKLAQTLEKHIQQQLEIKGEIPDDVIKTLMDHRLILQDEVEETTFIQRLLNKSPGEKVGHLRLSLSEACNLGCSYCYVPSKQKWMTFEIAREAIQKYLFLLQKHQKKGTVTFFGGEPLLNWSVLVQAANLVRELDPEQKYIRSLQIVTNGVLLNAEKILFLKEAKVAVSISVDGPQKIHDQVRVTKGTKEGTFDRIAANIATMIAMQYPPSSLVCTIGDHNIDCLKDIILFSKERKLFLQINDAFAECRRYQFSEKQLVKKLFEAEVFAKKNGMKIGGTWRWPFDRLFGENYRMGHCIANGGELSIDCDGIIKPCPGFEVSFGTIQDLDGALHSKTYQQFNARATTNLPECCGCEIEGLCGGGCMLNASKVHQGDIFRKGQSCQMFKTIFKKLVQQHLEEAMS